jgi:hypothetical protein|nr:MAG TPA: hypothetical protein [Caudoviricetes sp.]
MKVLSVKPIKSTKPVKVIDCFVNGGYVQGASGSLP